MIAGKGARGGANGATGAPTGPSAREPASQATLGTAPIAWRVVGAVGGKAKVWYQPRYRGDSLKASVLAAQLTSVIWPRLTGRFWAPPPDDSVCYPAIAKCYAITGNGGDAAFDVYLLHLGSTPGGTARAGVAMQADAHAPCDIAQPYYVMLDSRRPLGSATTGTMHQTLAHELAHAITLSHGLANGRRGCREYQWIREATGTWASEFVYPKANVEHSGANDFLVSPQDPLNYTTNDEVQYRHYGTYLFPFYLAISGKEKAIADMWKGFSSNASSLAAIDAALGGSLDEEFPRFAVANWNRGSADDYLRKDQFTEGALLGLGNKPKRVSVAAGQVTTEQVIIPQIHYLAAKYSNHAFDAAVRMVTFNNTMLGIKHASVWGIQKIGGTWLPPQDWSADSGKTWCRNKAKEDLEQLVIVFTNRQWRDTTLDVVPLDHPEIKAYSRDCSGYTGSVTGLYTVSTGALGTWTEKVTATVRFDIESALVTSGEPIEYYKATSGIIQWTATAVGGECTGSFAGSINIRPLASDNHMAGLRVWDDGAGRLVHSGGSGAWEDSDQPVFTLDCRGTPMRWTLQGMSNWWSTGPTPFALARGSQVLQGSYVSPGMAPATQRWSWVFRPG